MIPSPTKLALLTGVVLLVGEVRTHPTRYDQRQDGDLNVRADVEDIVFVAVPPKDYFANGISWLGTNIIRHNPNRIPAKTVTKHGFVPTEKSPYKVDLGKSTIPLMKLQAPVVEEVKLYKIRDSVKGDDDVDHSKVLMSVVETTTSDNKTVKKDLKASSTTEEAPASSTVKDEKKKPEGDGKEKGSKLKLIGASDDTSIAKHEDCGPGAHRDDTGKCVYE